MTKEEIRDMVEAILVANMDYASKITDQFMGIAKSGIFAQGLQFECEASEIRDLLRRRSSQIRSRADVIEGELQRVAHQVFDGSAAMHIASMRAGADRLDWHASHLVEKRYMLSVHDIEMFMPSEPTMTFPYDPARSGVVAS